MGFSQWKILEIFGKRMWIMWGNYCGLGWIIVDKSPGGFHKSRIGGKCGRIMCIKKSTLIIPQIKGFFENDVNKLSEKVDRFPVNPQVIHKLSTKCG